MATKKRTSRRKTGAGVTPFLVGLAAVTLALLATLQWVVSRRPTLGPDPQSPGGSKPAALEPRPRQAQRPTGKASPKPAPAKPPVVEVPKPADKGGAKRQESERASVTPGSKPRAPSGRPRGVPIAIVIDDCGRDAGLMKRGARFPWAMTFAVLPFLSDSKGSAEIAHRAGQEVILHQPMEPFGTSSDPGKGAIFTGMRGTEVQRLLRENLRSIPHVQGLNNHMGSKATADQALMNEVLAGLIGLKSEFPALYFLDSRTWAGTVAYDTVHGHGLPAAERTDFLDNEDQPVRQQVEAFLAAAERDGSGIGIGHLKAGTLDVLESVLSALPPGKFDLVFASELAR